MATLSVDTHRLIEMLKKQGFSEEQAEGLTDAIRSIDLSHLATKSDLNNALKDLELRLTTRVATFIGIGIAVQSAIIATMQIVIS